MATSLVMTVGKKFYKLHEIISEAEDIGVSKRIPITAVPEGLEKGKSKVFLAHPEAIVRTTAKGLSLVDLSKRLYAEELLTEQELDEIESGTPFAFWVNSTLEPYDFVPFWMLNVTVALSRCSDKLMAELDDEYGLEFCMGIFGWAPWTGIQYVAGKNEDGLPEDLQHMDGYVEAVHVIYIEGDGEDAVDEE